LNSFQNKKALMTYLLPNHQTPRLLFREISLSDFGTWLKFFENPETSKHWAEEKETPNAACKKWYARQQERYENNLGGMNALIEKSSGQLVGHCGLSVQTVDEVTELEIGYSLLPEFWGKGFAIEAVQKCKEYAFENNLTTSLISIISLSNLPSQKVATKNRMSIEKQTVYKGNQVYIFRVSKLT
jgi:[ribosomal protein S5]-alanine N-acetyltransferase